MGPATAVRRTVGHTGRTRIMAVRTDTVTAVHRVVVHPMTAQLKVLGMGARRTAAHTNQAMMETIPMTGREIPDTTRVGPCLAAISRWRPTKR